MVALWEVEIEADTRIQKAVGWVALKNDLQPLIGELLDLRFDITDEDRRVLAEYLQGKYKNPPGRRPANRRTVLDTTITSAQLAAIAVREAMEERRGSRQSIHGWKDKFIEQYAQEYGADPETVRNHLKRSQKPRQTKKLRGVFSSTE